jgi:hypothetical protein
VRGKGETEDGRGWLMYGLALFRSHPLPPSPTTLTHTRALTLTHPHPQELVDAIKPVNRIG